MRVLVTRPEPDASDMAAVLRARGHEVIVDPRLHIRTIERAALPSGPHRAAIVTSGNALRALADHPERARITALPLYAVAGATASRAEALGFADVRAGAHGAAALAERIMAECRPEDGPLLYLAGVDRMSDIEGVLRGRGFTVDVAELYAAEIAGDLLDVTRTALDFGNIDVVVLASRRTGQSFLDGVAAAGLTAKLAAVTAVVISPQVARAMERAPFFRVEVAQAATEDALLDGVRNATVAGFRHLRPAREGGTDHG